MTDSELIGQFAVLQPDLLALVRAVVAMEIKKWADARRDGLLREARYLEKHVLAGEQGAGVAGMQTSDPEGSIPRPTGRKAG
ncbi:MAG: hypothetical protein L0Y58_22345 [Verrucomicrobia subdivision 3 bacterium]|nr:hypothetical protein [Limisphaerales bacterium]